MLFSLSKIALIALVAGSLIGGMARADVTVD